MFEASWDTLLPLFVLICAISALLIEKGPGARTSSVGRVVLMLSALGLVTGFFVERLKQEKAEQQERIQTRKVLERIDYLRLTCELSIKAENPELAAYGRFLKKHAATCLTETASLGTRGGASFRVAGSCLPQGGSLAEAAFSGFILQFEAYKDDASTCDAPKPQDQSPDLAGRFPAALDDGNVDLEYDPQENRFTLYARNLRRDLYDLEPSGEITSVPDLENARVFLRFSPLDGRALELYRSFRPHRLTMHFLSPRHLRREISQDQLTKVLGGPLPSYAYCLQSVN